MFVPYLKHKSSTMKRQLSNITYLDLFIAMQNGSEELLFNDTATACSVMESNEPITIIYNTNESCSK